MKENMRYLKLNPILVLVIRSKKYLLSLNLHRLEYVSSFFTKHQVEHERHCNSLNRALAASPSAHSSFLAKVSA
jgi:hypothetical protein